MTLTANWNYPTPICFGNGWIKEIGEICKAAGISNPLFVTDRGLSEMAITKNTLAIMDEAGLGNSIFSDVDQNPSDTNAEAGVEFFRNDALADPSTGGNPFKMTAENTKNLI